VIQHVIWDWNGTLLDDVDACVDTINSLLSERAMGTIDREHYLKHFGFPVRNFYTALGFDLQSEDFGTVSTTFIDRYHTRVRTSVTHDETHDTLTRIGQRGIRQHVVSAMEETMLHRMLNEHAIFPHLEHVRGLDHIHATSKIQLGTELLATLDCDPTHVLFVGDTLHDHETASAMGCHCVLFGRGHQHPTRLANAGVEIIHQLRDIHDTIDAHDQRTGRLT